MTEISWGTSVTRDGVALDFELTRSEEEAHATCSRENARPVVIQTGLRWMVARLELVDPPPIGPIEHCRVCGTEEWEHSWLDHMQ